MEHKCCNWLCQSNFRKSVVFATFMLIFILLIGSASAAEDISEEETEEPVSVGTLISCGYSDIRLDATKAVTFGKCPYDFSEYYTVTTVSGYTHSALWGVDYTTARWGNQIYCTPLVQNEVQYPFGIQSYWYSSSDVHALLWKDPVIRYSLNLIEGDNYVEIYYNTSLMNECTLSFTDLNGEDHIIIFDDYESYYGTIDIYLGEYIPGVSLSNVVTFIFSGTSLRNESVPGGENLHNIFATSGCYNKVGGDDDPGSDDSIPEYDYNDSYEGPEGDYSSGISSEDIADKYNLTVITGSDLSLIPNWATVAVLVPNSHSYTWDSSEVTSLLPSGFDYDVIAIDVDMLSDTVGNLSSSYDVILVPSVLYSSESDDGAGAFSIWNKASFVTERFYKRQVLVNLSDGWLMISDYLYDLSEQNNAMYSVLYSGLKDSSSPLVQLKNNSITQLKTLNSILTAINNIPAAECNFVPYDDSDVLQWMSDTYTLLEAQELGTKLDSIINALNGTLIFDQTELLQKLDEVITAIENINITVGGSSDVQEEQDSLLGDILDILKEAIKSIIKVATKLLGVIVDFIGDFLDDVLDLFDYVTKIFTDGLDDSNEYMTVFESEDTEINAVMNDALGYLSIFSFTFTAFPKIVQIFIVLSVLIGVIYIFIREV